jgi:ribonuclease Z
MKVHLLGSGSALVTERRGNTMLAVSAGATSMLVDCSGTPVRALLGAGIDLRSLSDVVLTHHHPDHLYGLVSLVHELYIGSRRIPRGPLRLLGPARAIETASRLLDAAGLGHVSERGLELRLELLPLAPQTTGIGELAVTTFPVAHTVPALGVKVAMAAEPARSFVYSGDTAPIDSVLEASQGAALLFHECTSFSDADALPGHTTLSQIAALAGGTTAQRIVLVHIPPVAPVDEGAVRRELMRTFGGRVVLGDDGRSWDV